MIALCDMDSLLWIISYNHREFMDDPGADIAVQRAADDFVKTILTIVQADSYVGVFSPEKNFRHEVYKYAKYKGERPERPDWFVRFGPVIKQWLTDKWGFFTVPDLEADDVICALAEYYGTKRNDPNAKDWPVGEEWIICSPDKDLRQIAGLHYDYKKEGASPMCVSAKEAEYNFWYQMLAGDTSDNVKGINGLGPKKVEALFKECEDPFMWGTIVMAQYVKYFGNYYGSIIYQETKDTLQLMCSRHRLWQKYDLTFSTEIARPFNNTLEEASPFNEPVVWEQLDESRKVPYHKENIEKLLEQAEMLDPYGTIEMSIRKIEVGYTLDPNDPNSEGE